MVANSITDAIDQQLKPVEKARKDNLLDLDLRARNFRNLKGDPGVLLMLFTIGLMSSGSSYDSEVDNKLGGTGKGTFIGGQEDKIRLVATQKAVSNAFSAEIAKAQQMFNDAKDPSKKITPQQIKDQLDVISKGLDDLEPLGLFVISGSPFDKQSIDSMRGAINGLKSDMDNIQSKYGSFDALYKAAATPGDVEAASIIKGVTDKFSTSSSVAQTVSNTLQTQMQFINGDYQQYLGLLSSLIESLKKQVSAPLANQPKN